MYQPQSVTQRVSDFLALLTKSLEFFLSQKVAEVAKDHPGLAAEWGKRYSADYRVVPSYDADFVKAKIEVMEGAYQASSSAFSDAFGASKAFVQAVEAAQAGEASLDCATLASLQHAIHTQILLFQLQAAQAVCAMEEIQGAIQLLHECLPLEPSCWAPAGQPSGVANSVAQEKEPRRRGTGRGSSEAAEG
jgi:hypothetical protein